LDHRGGNQKNAAADDGADDDGHGGPQAERTLEAAVRV